MIDSKQQPDALWLEFVAVLRHLSRHRLLVAVGMVLALLAGTFVRFDVRVGLPPRIESKQYKAGVASAQVLVDSQSSQVIDLGGGPAFTNLATLIARARLLANLLATSPLKDRIARRAGIDPRTFSASAPALGTDGPTPPPAVNADPAVTRGNILSLSFGEQLPIITADARAPDARTASRIASAAVAELEAYLASTADEGRVPQEQRLVVEPLGPPRSRTVQRGPRRTSTIMAMFFVFGLWCTGIVAIPRLLRLRREAAGLRLDGASRAIEVMARHARPASPAPPAPTQSRRRPKPPPAPDSPVRPERPERSRRRVS